MVPVLTRSLAGKLGSEPDELLPSRSLTPLHLCAALDTSPHDWLKLGFRGDYTKGDSIHCTPLELAVYRRSELAIRLMLGQLDASQQRLQASRLLIRASEILDVSGMQLLLGLGADASAKDERQLSALEVFIQRGAPRKLQVSFKVPLVSDVDFCRMVDQLIQNGASTHCDTVGTVGSEMAAGATVSCMHHMLAHVPWMCWPASLQRALEVQLETGATESFCNAGVHALAACPSDVTIRVMRLLLEAGASARAQLYGSKQSALHILAAGGAYLPEQVGPATRQLPDKEAQAQHRTQMAQLLLQHGAMVQQRDSFNNLPMHLACKSDSVDMVQFLCGAGSGFEAPWTNNHGLAPLDVAPANGRASELLFQRKADLQRAREERAAQLSNEILPSSIDVMLDVSLDELLGSTNSQGEPTNRHSSLEPMASQVANKSTAIGGDASAGGKMHADIQNSSSPTATPNEGEAPLPHAKLKLVHRTEGRDLCGRLRFEGQRFSVCVTRHVLSQLRLLDQAKIRTALRLLHRLAGDDVPESTARLDIGRGVPLFASVLNEKRRDAIWIIWERDEPLKGEPSERLSFYEATHAVRIWSVETTASHHDEVAGYVARAWRIGAGAAEVARNQAQAHAAYPMGTTATVDTPSDTWYPRHADDNGELQVPYIIKWYRICDQLVHYLLVLMPEAGDALQADFQLPMLLDENEQKLSAFADGYGGSRLLVGRSGTGKTSIALDILLKLHTANCTVAPSPEAYKDHKDTIFVCKSKKLCVSVSKQFDELVRVWGCDGQANTVAIAEAFVHGHKLEHPLFISSSELYTLLDRTLARAGSRSFFADSSEASAFVRELSGTGDLLEALDREDLPVAQERDAAPTTRRGAARSDQQRRLLTYERFCRLADKSRSFTRELQAVGKSAVYREIFSYIKGSAEAMETDFGFLNENQYLARPHKASSLPEALRPAVYRFFAEYKSKLSELRLYDLPDLVFHLFRARRNGKLPCTPIQRVVVDEVQDLLLAEVKLLIELAGDKNGLFLCGDTAQTISRGVGFRFADVKALFHGLDPSAATPALEHLSLNYRTHTGIVNCAAAVVQLLLERFPTAVDKLPSERGHFYGPPPALLHETDPDALVETMLAAGDVGLTEMGANQVVIVRSEACKDRLPVELRAGLSLTVEESKGLEFDDVCVYNFVSESPAGRDSAGRELWLVLSGAVEFDKHRHLLLEEELKALYVALTRARKRCFIFDRDVEARTPLFETLAARGVAEKGAEQQLSVRATAASRSTDRDWQLRGENLYANKLYAHAEKCFLKGHARSRALEAGHHRLLNEGASLQGQERAACYRMAAMALILHAKGHPSASEQSASAERAAKIFCAAGRHAKEGNRGSHYRDAGRVLREALGRPRAAAACFVMAACDAPSQPHAWDAALEALFEGVSDHAGDEVLEALQWLEQNASRASSSKKDKHREDLVMHITRVRDSFEAELCELGV